MYRWPLGPGLATVSIFRLQRLHALQHTFYDQLSSLEDGHSEHQATSQQLLEKETVALRKKILADKVSKLTYTLPHIALA